MESNHLHYIVIFDNIDQSKLSHYENIFKVCNSENNHYSLFFINNDSLKNHDVLCTNELLLEGLVSGKIDIYNGNNIKDFLKNAFCIFYFLDYKDDFFTRNLKEILSFNKFILHKPMDKYKALINVLKDLIKNTNHIFNQNNFLNHYHKLNGSNELNHIFHLLKNGENKNEEKKIRLIKKVNLPSMKEEDNKEEEDKEEEDKEEDNKEEDKEEDKKKLKNKVILKKNINIQFSKKSDLNINQIYITYYTHTNHDITNEIQIKCIIENIKNNLFNKYILFYDINEELLKNELNKELNEELLKNISFIQNDSKINKIISYLNDHCLGDIVYLARSDILIPIQSEIKNIQMNLLENNYVYAISRIERRVDGTIFKEPSFNNLLYSHLQDLYIFKPKLNLNNDNQIYNELDFYENNFEILFNKLLESNGYNIINDTIQCKIIRIMCNNNINERHIMKKCSINYKDYDCSYIAENSILNKFTLENYIKNLDLSEEEIYLVKQYIFKLFIKKNNLI
jgi:hypothetical protein